MILEGKEWYVFYTRSRCEKKVNDYLLKYDFDVFLPTHKVLRQWSDRKKKVEVPLFNSYIFVKVRKDQIHEVLKTPGIVKNLMFNGEPAILKESECCQIKQWLETGLPVEVEGINYDFRLGERVKVLDGVFQGVEGDIYKKDEDTYFVTIESIQQMLIVRLRREFLSMVD